jgi:hypothetical protein
VIVSRRERMVMICYPLEKVLHRVDPFAELLAPGVCTENLNTNILVMQSAQHVA